MNENECGCGSGAPEKINRRELCTAVLVDEERVGFGVDVLHGALEAVERARLRQLHLVREIHVDVLQHDTWAKIFCRLRRLSSTTRRSYR